MEENYSVFNIPNFTKNEIKEETPQEGYNFEIYNELNQIAEELEECRLRNC